MEIVVDEISLLRLRLFVAIDRVTEPVVLITCGGGGGGGGETARAVRVGFVVGAVFNLNSPSGIVSNFSLAAQLENRNKNI